MSKSGKKNVAKPKADKQKDVPSGIKNSSDYLRDLRNKKGLSITDVCEATRISETNIKAMESRDYSALPADTFIRGLLNIYAEFLGEEDPSHIVSRFMEERNESQMQGKRIRAKQSKSILTPRRLAEPVHVSSISMAGILLLVIIVLLAGFGFYTSWNPLSFLFNETGSQPHLTNIIPDTTSAQPEQTKVSLAVIDNTTEETYILTVRFLEDTRVKVIRNGDEPVSEVYSKGDEQTWDTASSIQVTFDKPASGTILVNDTPVDFPAGQEGLFTLRIPADLPTPPAND